MNRTVSISTVLALAAIAVLTGPAANAQNLLFNQTSFTFTIPFGTTAVQQQPLFIYTSTGAVLPYTSSIVQSGNWLSLSPASANTGIAATISVNPANLAQGSYVGTITITAQGATNSPQTITVNLTIGAGAGSSVLTSSPASLSFSYTAGGTIPAAQNLSITSTGAVPFTVSVSTQTGGSWLFANPASGTTPATISVGVNPLVATAGTHNGTVLLTPTGFPTSSPLAVQVTLTVASSPELKVSAIQPFNYQLGTGSAGLPPSQTLSVTSTAGSLTFNASVTPQTGGSWLVLSPTGGGSTPADLTLSVSNAALAGLGIGTYRSTVTITAPGASNPTTNIEVVLNISTSPFVNVSPASLSFTVQPNGALPQTQSLNITSTTSNLPFQAVVTPSVSWLSATPATGTTPGTVTVGLTASAPTLLPGNYTASITITTAGAANPTVSIPVTLEVTNTPALIASPSALYFNFQTGKSNPAAQTVAVTSSGIPTQFSVSATTASGGSWLQVNPAGAAAATTPATLVVSVNPAGLAPNTYTGTITLTPAASGASPVTINVTFNVSNNPLMNVSPAAVSFSVPQGSTSVAPQSIALTSTGDPLNFTATFSTTPAGSTWLAVVPVVGSTPINMMVYIFPGSLPVGVYNGTITVSATNANSQTIPVTLTVTTGATLNVSPNTLTFTQAQGGAAAAPQTISVSATGSSPVAFAASATSSSPACGNWLSVAPANGSTPATLTVTPAAVALAAGTPCFGQITIQAPGTSNSPFTVPATLNITQPATLAANPASLNFSFQVGGSAPPAQTVQLTSTPSSTAFTVAATTQSGGDWLSATASGGTTPATISVSLKTQNLTQAGTFNGTVSVTSAAASNSPLTIPVTVTVTAVVPRVTTVRNAASYAPGPVAPGEIIYVEGTNIGPASLTTLTVNNQGLVNTTLAETRVLFEGIPAPLVWVWHDRLSCIVPYGVAGRLTVRMQVEYRGQLSAPIDLAVTDAAPGIFTLNQAGTGQGAILNQDYSVNGPPSSTSRPAAPGSVVMIYATGEGQTLPAGVDGRVNTSTLPRPLLPVTVQIGGLDAEVLYAGAAPSFVSGAMQINVRVPRDIGSGNAVPVLVRIGNKASQGTVTMAVQ